MNERDREYIRNVQARHYIWKLYERCRSEREERGARGETMARESTMPTEKTVEEVYERHGWCAVCGVSGLVPVTKAYCDCKFGRARRIRDLRRARKGADDAR